MYLGLYNFYNEYNKNKMLIDASSPIGDDLAYPFVFLGKYLNERGHRVNTIDMDELKNFDAILFLEFPGKSNTYFEKLLSFNYKYLYLLNFEHGVTKPDNWTRSNHNYFRKIFTWNDDFVDNKKYIKINTSYKNPSNLEFDIAGKKKLCTIIAGYKLSDHPLELYSERINAIRWFERNHPEDFNLYGIGWDTYTFKGKLSRLNRFEFLRKLFSPRFSSYKGKIKNKRDILKNYKFSICYENAKDISGYITEKIFDCFFAGCVPIYLGASNITKHIPENAFIDRRKFRSYEEVYSFIKNMPEKEYEKYLINIKDFLLSDKFQQFSVEYFAKTIMDNIIEDIQV